MPALDVTNPATAEALALRMLARTWQTAKAGAELTTQDEDNVLFVACHLEPYLDPDGDAKRRLGACLKLYRLRRQAREVMADADGEVILC